MTGGSDEQQATLQRFQAACEHDGRIVAAFLGGSCARGKADEWSDLDIYLIAEDDGYEAFFAERQAFMRQLGEPVFMEDFNDFGFDMVLFTFANGVEGELSMARESGFEHIHGGPHTVLVDKKGLLEGKTFALYQPAEADQRRALRHAIYWFWEHLSHFIAGIGRKQMWTAYGSLDEMRMKCLKLARLKHDFVMEHSAYSGVEQYVPEEELRPLVPTCTLPEAEAMLRAARALVEYYRQIAPTLAAKYGIAYPADLERVILARFDRVGGAV
jgi:predicted nucleotidyltransferase